MEDAFWTISAMVNYGMTAMPMEIRFETLMGSFFQGNINGNNGHETETRYRLWVTSFNQPALLFSSIVTSLQDPIKNYGSKFPTLLKTLIDDSRIGSAQIDLVNEGPKFASLVMRRIIGNSNNNLSATELNNGKRSMPWFGCRLEIADDARVREHLTTMVLSLRRERDEEKQKREALEAELACYKSAIKNSSSTKNDDNDEIFQGLLSTIAAGPSSNNSPIHLLSRPSSNNNNDRLNNLLVGDEDAEVPTDFVVHQHQNQHPRQHRLEEEIRVITPIIRGGGGPIPRSQPSSSSASGVTANITSRPLITTTMTPPINTTTPKQTPSSADILRGVATYVLCALCPEGNQTAEPDESSIIDHIVSQHFDGESKTCHGCPSRTEVRDVPSHMKMHMSKLYECKYCGKQGRKRNVLTAHLRTHTGEKPYVCPYCSRRFADASTLRRHRTTHTGEMRAACPICGRIISRRDNVKAHLRNNHGIEWTESILPTLKDFENMKSGGGGEASSDAFSSIPIIDASNTEESEHENPQSNQSSTTTTRDEESEFDFKPQLAALFDNHH